MITLADLRAKVPADVLAARDDVAIAGAFNAGRTRTENAAIANVQAYLQTHGLWWAIKAVAANNAHPAYAAAVAILDVANARYENIDMSLPIVGQMLGGLVATSIIAQADMDALTAMGVVADPISVSEISSVLNGVTA